MNRKSAAAFAWLAIAPAGAAHAAPVLFDFENQLGFETAFSVTNNGLTASFSSPADTTDLLTGAPAGGFAVTSSYNLYRNMSGLILNESGATFATGQLLTITFSAPITALSLQFGLDDLTGAVPLSYAILGGKSGDARGVIPTGGRYTEGTLSLSADPFTTIVLSANVLDFAIDTVLATPASTVAPVPEPIGLGLLAVAATGLFAARRRA